MTIIIFITLDVDVYITGCNCLRVYVCYLFPPKQLDKFRCNLMWTAGNNIRITNRLLFYLNIPIGLALSIRIPTTMFRAIPTYVTGFFRARSLSFNSIDRSIVLSLKRSDSGGGAVRRGA